MDNQDSLSQQRFWSLLSKKLANEATNTELQELRSILLSNSNLHHQADLITEMWDQVSRNSIHTNEVAYTRHVMKYKDEFFTDESNETITPLMITDEPETEQPSFFRSFFSRRLTIV